MGTGRDLVREIVEALNRGDLEAMLARLDPDFEWRPLEASPVAPVYRGPDEVRRYVQDWLGTFESLRLELCDAREAGDRVIAEVRGHGRGRGSGLALESRFWQVWTFRDEKALAMEEHPSDPAGRQDDAQELR